MPGYRLDYKYIMATVVLKDENDNQFCLGTALLPKSILTTASCVINRTRDNNFRGMYVWGGGNFNEEHGKEYYVDDVDYNQYYHNPFTGTDDKNNIGLIMVSFV